MKHEAKKGGPDYDKQPAGVRPEGPEIRPAVYVEREEGGVGVREQATVKPAKSEVKGREEGEAEPKEGNPDRSQPI